MRLLVLWTAVAPYLASQLRQLQGEYAVDVHMVTRPALASGDRSFDSEVLDGLMVTLLSDSELQSFQVLSRVIERSPDVVLVSGWMNPGFRRLINSSYCRNSTVVLAFDTRFTGTWRQRWGRYRHPRYFRRVDRVFVPGASAERMAQALGFPPSDIYTGLFAVSRPSYEPPGCRPTSSSRPQRFLYVGRLTEKKGLDVLLSAYALYQRSAGEDAWSLELCGQGPLREAAEKAQGVRVNGFVQPNALPGYYAEAGAFVLPSRDEPCGLVVAEACAAGLPLVVSEAVGAAADLVVRGRNGIVVSPGSVDDLAGALMTIARRPENQLRAWGSASYELSKPYDIQAWPARFMQVVSSRSSAD